MKKSEMVQNGHRQKAEPVVKYREEKLGKILYRVTSVYKGEFELEKALEDLTVRKILRNENVTASCQ